MILRCRDGLSLAACLAAVLGCGGGGSGIKPGDDGGGGSGAGNTAGAGAGTGGATGTGGAPATGGAGGDQVVDAGTGGQGQTGTGGSGPDAGDSGVIGPPPPTQRHVTPIVDGWKFTRMDVAGAEASAFDDSAWTAVTLPHTWNNMDGQDGGGNYYRGIGWYRSHVMVPSTEAGRRVYIEFDGANIATTVYVNGMMAGTHKGGFARFRFDVTKLVTLGAMNVLAVQVSNAAALSATVPPVAADFTFFGGIYRPARLVTVDPLHLDMDSFGSSGVAAVQKTVSAQAAAVDVRVSVTNARAAAANVMANVKVLSPDGAVATMASGTGMVAAGATSDIMVSLSMTNPHLWDGLKDPYLYRLTVEVQDGASVVDAGSEPLGLRTAHFDAAAGMTLNGKVNPMRGVNKHQDRLNKGWAVSDADLDEDMSIIRELGATGLRLAHYQHAQHFYDLCDKYGLMVWAELPVVNAAPAGAEFSGNATQQLQELIRQNINHPSILMWSLSNEVVVAAPAAALMTALNTVAHTEDPSRPTVLATNYAANSALTQAVDLEGVNRYAGWYGGSYTGFAGIVDQNHAAAGRPLAVSEYGAGAGINTHTKTPMVMDHSEEYQCLLHEAHWKAIAARPFLWGTFLWNLFDFASDSRKEGEAAGRNDKGLVTYDRQTKKDSFYYYKANWSDDPFVYVTERRWSPRPAGAYDVKVYSNGTTASLKVNGIDLAAKTAADHIFIWPGVMFKAGANMVEASATVNGMPKTDTLTIMGM